MAEVEVITAKQLEEFERLLLENPEMKRKVKKVLSQVLAKARAAISSDTKAILERDPRQSYRAIKRAVYKKILGGSISLLNKKRASNTRCNLQRETVYDREPWHRGGNRCKRSDRTDAVDSYFGADRGFILRFLNNGTTQRQTRYGNRGAIAPRNWFGRASNFRMEQMAGYFSDLIDGVIKEQTKQSS